MRRTFIAWGLVFAFALLAWALMTGAPERTVYVGGPILTMDSRDRIVSGLGIEGRRIASVGSEDEVRNWGGPDARVVELGGSAIVPGFIDAHGHFPGSGVYALVVDLNSPPIGSVVKIEQLLDLLRQRADETPEDEWILGLSYDDTLLEEKRHPTRRELDRVSTQHPVGIVHVSGHLAVANSLALEKLGIDENSPDPEGGRLRRDAVTGHLNGLLEENAMVPLMETAMPLGVIDGFRITRKGTEQYAAAGVTTAQSGLTDSKLIDGLHLMSRLGLIPIRLVLWPNAEATDDMLTGGWSFDSYDEDWVRLGAVKLVADGSIQGYTGYLSEPYFVPPADDPSYRGYPRIASDELMERVARYHDAGLQIAVHGNGDAAIDDILDAFEAAENRNPRDDTRKIIIHAQMARPDQLDRMAALGVIPSFFVLHTYYWGDRHRDIFMGPERAARMSPTASASQRGIPFTIHADAPVVPMAPLRIIWAAVNRRSTSGAEIGPEERISPMRALRAVTIDAARQHFEEDRKGSLEVGKLADLVLLSESPLANPERIDEIQVLETIVGGKTIYRADDSPD